MAMGNSNIEPDQVQKAWDGLVQSCPLLFDGKDSYCFECKDGWFDLIAEICKGVEALIDAMPEGDRYEDYGDGERCTLYTIGQIKEKYGTLRFYMNGAEVDGSEELIEAAEEKSAKTCEVCGKPGETRSTSWISTLCDDHYGVRTAPK